MRWHSWLYQLSCINPTVLGIPPRLMQNPRLIQDLSPVENEQEMLRFYAVTTAFLR
jgi:hypothetical protein